MLTTRARTCLVALCLLLVAALAGQVAPAAAQAEPGAAGAPRVWTPTTLRPLPHGPDSDSLDTVSCPAVGSCVAVGYSDVLGGVVETLADGGWTTTALPGPDGSGIRLSHISCASATSCDALGYSGSAGTPVLARLHNGSWSYTKLKVTGSFEGISCASAEHCTAIGNGPDLSQANKYIAISAYDIDGTSVTQSQLSLPPDLADVYSVSAAGISCPTVTRCTAVGTAVIDPDDYSGDNPFAETLSDGIWTASDLPYAHDTFVSSVSCPSVTTCYAIGQVQSRYGPANGSSYAIKIADGTTTTTNLGADVQFSTVSCADDTHCVAFGSDDPSIDYASNHPASAVLAGGTWTDEIRAYPPGTSGLHASPGFTDCATVSFCVTVGSFNLQVDDDRPHFLAEIYSAGAWSASEADIIAGEDPIGSAAAVSCQSITSCVVVGSEVDVSDRIRPQAEVLAGDAWTRTTLPQPAGASAATLSAVSCVAADRCTAVGNYTSADGRQLLFADSLSGRVWTTHRIGLGLANGHVESLTGIVCFTATSCVAAGYYLQKGTFPYSADIRPIALVLSGTTWTRTRLPGRGEVNGLACQRVSSCVAVGGILGDTSVGDQPATEAWTLSGSTWTMQYLPHNIGVQGPLVAVSCRSTSSCTAIGGGGSYEFAETLTGGSWSQAALPSAYLGSISCVTATRCTAVGEDDEQPAIETRTASGWTERTLAAPARGGEGSTLSDVQCFTTTSCIAAGTAFSARDPYLSLPLIEQRF